VKNYVALSSTFQNCGNMEVLDALEYSWLTELTTVTIQQRYTCAEGIRAEEDRILRDVGSSLL
jgi:hypothetical protein